MTILCLDFDGVLHSYTSGWKGARHIPDPPMPGALEFLEEAMQVFDVHVLSSRSHQLGGRSAMKRWLRHHVQEKMRDCDDYRRAVMHNNLSLELYDKAERQISAESRTFVSRITWPLFKPPAHMTIDDRAVTFAGEWPSMESIRDFRPWRLE